MTVTPTTDRWVYNGDGSSEDFVYDNVIYAATDLLVYLGGVLQTRTTHYTVSNVGVAGGGNVTFVTAPPPGTGNVVIVSDIPPTQPAKYKQGGDFPSATHETAMDRTLRIAQQALNRWLRTLRQPHHDATDMAEIPKKADRLDKVLSFDDTTGDPETVITVTAINDAAADAAAAAGSAAAALSSENSAAADAVSTDADAVSTAADAVSTDADAVSTDADKTAAASSAADAVVNAAGFRFDFDSDTTMADPGTGDVRFNNATVADVTALAFDPLSADTGNPDVSDFIATWDDSTNSALRGTIVIRKVGTPGTFAVFDVTGAVVDNTTWLQVNVAHVASNGTFSAADELIVHFTRTGDKGADGQGSGDVIGPASATDNALARYNTTTGKLLQDSKVIVDDDGNMRGHGAWINAQTDTTYTLTGADNGKVVTLDNAAAITLTLPETSTETIAKGFQCALIAKGAGQVTVAKEGTDTILSKGSNLKLTAQGSVATVIKLTAGSPNAWFLGGDLAA